MTVVTLREESARLGSFRVPRFEVKIAGAGLPGDVVRDVTQVTYRDNLRQIDSFEITVNNWDAATRDFKYVGSETSVMPTGKDAQRQRLFDPSTREVEVRMGYGGELTLMLKGHFTTIEPNFPAAGAPTLTVRGLNVLHQLRPKQYTTTWTDKKDSDIAKDIATLTDPDLGKKRFPLPIDVDPNAEEPELPYVAQRSQYDIDFLLSRARERGYVFVVVEGDLNATRAIARKRHLYFGPSQANVPALRRVTFELKWGTSLMDFKPTLSTANQVKAVTVQGWDRATAKPIHERVTLADRRLNVNRDLHPLLDSCDAREEVVVNEPVCTPAEARQRASAILMDRMKEMVKCQATSVGLPDLRAGQRVRITGIGARFSGTYFVTETTHTISDAGYLTRFGARREDDGKGATP